MVWPEDAVISASRTSYLEGLHSNQLTFMSKKQDLKSSYRARVAWTNVTRNTTWEGGVSKLSARLHDRLSLRGFAIVDSTRAADRKQSVNWQHRKAAMEMKQAADDRREMEADARAKRQDYGQGIPSLKIKVTTRKRTAASAGGTGVAESSAPKRARAKATDRCKCRSDCGTSKKQVKCVCVQLGGCKAPDAQGQGGCNCTRNGLCSFIRST